MKVMLAHAPRPRCWISRIIRGREADAYTRLRCRSACGALGQSRSEASSTTIINTTERTQ